MAGVSFADVSKRFGAVEAVSGLSLDIADGEFMVLVGPSGSGKTTALRMLAGLEEVDGGEAHVHPFTAPASIPRMKCRCRKM